ncbi:MAG: ATP-binding protein [Bacteroidales bacterium]|nr:ATP-binding protein [Bacteroidales bacterium]
MHKERLREILFDQNEVFNQQKHHLIDREIDLGTYIDTQQVVIISGIRRCGKSSLLFLIKEKMKLDETAYCYFNFDDERIIPDIEILEQIYNLHIEIHGNEPVLFFDEIQNINNWEKFVNRMYEKGTKLFVTGSNAKLLSSEISTSLTGRNKVLELFPFSFREYLSFKGKTYDQERLTSKQKALIQKDFNHYLITGGFPLVVRENDLELINSYFQDILYRDIVSRYRLSQVNEIKQIGLFFASNAAKLFSYATLQDISGVKSLSSIKDYLWYYEQSYLFFYLKKFDFSVKKQIMNPKKVYTIDPAISNHLGFNFSQNKGRVLENIVFIELLRRGKEIYYHAGKNKCDFLVKEGLNITEAIQVAWVTDQSNLSRQYDGLQEAMQLHQLNRGLLITYNTESDFTNTNTNIQTIPVWKWLMANQ